MRPYACFSVVCVRENSEVLLSGPSGLWQALLLPNVPGATPEFKPVQNGMRYARPEVSNNTHNNVTCYIPYQRYVVNVWGKREGGTWGNLVVLCWPNQVRRLKR